MVWKIFEILWFLKLTKLQKFLRKFQRAGAADSKHFRLFKTRPSRPAYLSRINPFVCLFTPDYSRFLQLQAVQLRPNLQDNFSEIPNLFSFTLSKYETTSLLFVEKYKIQQIQRKNKKVCIVEIYSTRTTVGNAVRSRSDCTQQKPLCDRIARQRVKTIGKSC